MFPLRLALFGAAVMSVACASAPIETGAPRATGAGPATEVQGGQQSEQQGGRFDEEIAAFRASDRAAPPPASPVLFVGSSSIRMWTTLATDFPGIDVLNRGFGGSETEDLLFYLDRVVFPYGPRRIVIYEGDNDLAAGKSPQRVADDFEQVVAHIRQRLPNVPIAFVSIKPSPSRWNLAGAMRSANQRIRLFCAAAPNLDYVDVFTPMLDENGRPRASLFLPDDLHMNATGYAIWKQVLAPFVTGEGPVPPSKMQPIDAFLDDVQQRTFRWFWDLAHPVTYLTPDRWPTESFASIAASGFALTAYAIGSERGYVTREQAARRVLSTLEFLLQAPQGEAPTGFIGDRGFFYHFLDQDSATRFRDIELSTVDTALMLMGALFCQSYFDHANAQEDSIRSVAEALYRRVDWRWAQTRPPLIGHGWTPEGGPLEYDWGGYNEAMFLYILALGSPTHAVSPAAWKGWTQGYRWGTYYGQEHVGFAPLFGHQYTQVWVDLRGIRDAVMRKHDMDYFENSRRATVAQRAYAMDNPMKWKGYGPRAWGLTACDGPMDGTVTLQGKARELHTYWGRGASFTVVRDDGTLCPSAAGGSVAFLPVEAIATLRDMRSSYGERVYSTYGFVDAFNPSLDVQAPVTQGRVHPGVGWFDTDYLGIDQGPILAMIENHRSGLVWKTMRRNEHIVAGLRNAGFTGGWLESTPLGP